MNTIIFDLGGVLIDWNPEYVFRSVLPDEEERRFFFDNICTHDWNIEQDAGRPLATATDMLVRDWPDWEAPIPDTVALLEELRDRGTHRLLALTNWSAETFPVALERYDFLQWFEGIVVSGEEKTRKPFADIYHILLQRYGVEAHRAVFIDDSLKNVDGAEAVGIKGIHFQGATALRTTLGNLNIR
jgi:2-haloacid dehalogenase